MLRDNSTSISFEAEALTFPTAPTASQTFHLFRQTMSSMDCHKILYWFEFNTFSDILQSLDSNTSSHLLLFPHLAFWLTTWFSHFLTYFSVCYLCFLSNTITIINSSFVESQKDEECCMIGGSEKGGTARLREKIYTYNRYGMGFFWGGFLHLKGNYLL